MLFIQLFPVLISNFHFNLICLEMSNYLILTCVSSQPILAVFVSYSLEISSSVYIAWHEIVQWMNYKTSVSTLLGPVDQKPPGKANRVRFMFISQFSLFVFTYCDKVVYLGTMHSVSLAMRSKSLMNFHCRRNCLLFPPDRKVCNLHKWCLGNFCLACLLLIFFNKYITGRPTLVFLLQNRNSTCTKLYLYFKFTEKGFTMFGSPLIVKLKVRLTKVWILWTFSFTICLFFQKNIFPFPLYMMMYWAYAHHIKSLNIAPSKIRLL